MKVSRDERVWTLVSLGQPGLEAGTQQRRPVSLDDTRTHTLLLRWPRLAENVML